MFHLLQIEESYGKKVIAVVFTPITFHEHTLLLTDRPFLGRNYEALTTSPYLETIFNNFVTWRKRKHVRADLMKPHL